EILKMEVDDDGCVHAAGKSFPHKGSCVVPATLKCYHLTTTSGHEYGLCL
ncbi:hypothetical protein CEXT_228691, partial [Caerostris extrusa]